MARSYYGWKTANDWEERRFDRELAKQAALLASDGSEPGMTNLRLDEVPLPWSKRSEEVD